MPQGEFESAIFYFEMMLHNFRSVSIISQTFETIRPVVTENLSRQNLGESGRAPRGAFDSAILKHVAKLQTHISIISQKVLNNSSGYQKLVRTKLRRKEKEVEEDE